MSGEIRRDNHRFGEDSIKEMSQHLYKSPKSAIKEGVSNGLDPQDKHGRIEIFTNVPPDGDIIIEDWGTGIEDYEEFITGLKGYKRVGDRTNSYDIIDPDVIGNKGVGKYSFLMLSNAEPPVVEFYSHRPKRGNPGDPDYRPGRGLKVQMFQKVTDGFLSEPMDTTDALPHPGVKVVIKKAKQDILPRDSSLMKYLSQHFAIRLKRGAKIYLNENSITPPEGFDSREFPLFTMNDGTVIKGNLKHAERSETNNVMVFIKTILVDSISFEHKVTGWVNDNLLRPTTSREAIEEDPRYNEFHEKLTQYLNENFEKPASERLTRTPMEKEKLQLGIKLLQYQKDKLSGEFDAKSSINGEITGGLDATAKWIKKQNVKLTKTGGDESGVPIIPIGPGERGGGGIRTGGTGNKPGIDKDGDQTILTIEGSAPRMREGPIKPNLKYIFADMKFDKPPSYQISPDKIVFNTSWPQSKKAHHIKGEYYAAVFLPVLAPAIIDYEIKTRGENPTREEWEKRCAEYIRVGLE